MKRRWLNDRISSIRSTFLVTVVVLYKNTIPLSDVFRRYKSKYLYGHYIFLTGYIRIFNSVLTNDAGRTQCVYIIRRFQRLFTFSSWLNYSTLERTNSHIDRTILKSTNANFYLQKCWTIKFFARENLF